VSTVTEASVHIYTITEPQYFYFLWNLLWSMKPHLD